MKAVFVAGFEKDLRRVRDRRIRESVRALMIVFAASFVMNGVKDTTYREWPV